MKLKDLKENDVIHIKSLEEAEKICKLIRKSNIKWSTKEKVFPTKEYFHFQDNYKDGVCLLLSKDDELYRESYKVSNEIGRRIIPASKFLKKKSWKKEVFQEIARLDSELNELKGKNERSIADMPLKKGERIELYPPKQEFEVGKWYKTLSNGAIFFPIRKETDIKYSGYGFDANGTWYDDTIWFIESSKERLATDEEVKEALVNEAKRRGFENTELMLFESFENRLVLHIEGFGTHEIFSNGIWANPEIMPNAISKETVDIDWSIPGQIVEHISSDTWFVINSGEHDDKYFIGTTLFDTNEIVNAGHYTKHPKCAFKLSDKKIELK